MDYNLKIVVILTVGFALASLLGYIAQKIKLPTVLGYLLAGYFIGPYSPGFVADIGVSEQLAEIGVILMLFGVGLHFRLEDLINVKNVAIPGAIGQTLMAAIAGTILGYSMGWPLQASVILGLAISVASTVVLVRVLTNNKLLETTQGHIAVGWLIVEDILTVAILVLLPLLAFSFENTDSSALNKLLSLFLIPVQFVLLAVIMFTWGHKVIAHILTAIARVRSHELFTLTILALIFVIATGSAFLFGTPIALGAFIAGMVVGQTDVRHQASANALPLQDVFVVIFFLTVGMLFNPAIIIEQFPMFVGLLGIILIIKPLAAFLIVLGLRYSQKIALTVALALAQIGEFSFILAEESMRLKLFPDIGYDLLVACALVSISLNPLLFRFFGSIDSKLFEMAPPRIARAKLLKEEEAPQKVSQVFELAKIIPPQVIVVGYGPIGRAVTHALEKINVTPLIIEQNIDTISEVKDENRLIIYGDAAFPNILETTHIATANLLVITVPDVGTTINIIKSALHLNPKIRILARVRYLADQELMEKLNVNFVCCEKESARALADAVVRLIRSNRSQ